MPTAILHLRTNPEAGPATISYSEFRKKRLENGAYYLEFYDEEDALIGMTSLVDVVHMEINYG